jgi:hypothetical protein
MGADFPDVRAIHRRMGVVGGDIVQLCVYQAMPPGATVALDGAWAHPRHSGQHTMSVNSEISGKPLIVHLVVLERSQGGLERPDVFVGNFDGPTTAMETGAIREFARLEATRPGGSRIGVLVTDGQNSIQTICAQAGWHPRHELDPGHLMRSVERRISAHKGYLPPGGKPRRLVMAQLKPFLVHWFRACGKRKASLEQKQADWDGALGHYTSAGSKWAHKEDPFAVELLSRLLMDVRPLLAKYQVVCNTQACEAFNALRSKLEDKDTSWKATHGPRSYAAALIFNFGYEWVVEFCEETQIDLEPELIEWVCAESRAIMARRAEQRTPQFRRTKNAARVERKARESAKKRASDVVHEDETRIEDEPLESRDRVGAPRAGTKPRAGSTGKTW